jgi:cytochrome c
MNACGLLLLCVPLLIIPANACNLDQGREIFALCSACHTLDGVTGGREGPNLGNAFGSPAGQDPNYRYSPAMLKAALTWDAATLERFLMAPKRTVPGTTMVFIGLKDAAERAAVSCYLETARRTGKVP